MTSPHPQEIELKLLLPADAVPAFLKRMARRRTAPVEQELVTRYFDTPDFELSGLGVALRVRRNQQGASPRSGRNAGRRWLQTLKTEGERQGGLSRRVEYEMPVARGALDWLRFPPEARERVPAALRERVVPVFETRFRRTAWQLRARGGAQIEVALDRGEIVAGNRSLPLCEIELELKAGQPEALFDLALDWAAAFGCLPFDPSKAERGVQLARGIAAAPVKSANVVLAPGMSVEDGFASIVQACLAQFQANLPGLLGVCPLAGAGASAGDQALDEIEYLHQARVALRRLRAALRLFRRVCALPDDLLAGLRGLAAALGPARDWDVLLVETLPVIAPHAPDPQAWQRGLAVLDAHRATARADMRAALDAARPGAWLLAMQRWLQARGWRHVSDTEADHERRFAQLEALDDWARQALKRGHRRIVRDARRFGQLAPDERHALRIAIKRQRYAAEFFQTLFAGGRQARYLGLLRAAQDSLGSANDARIAAELIGSAAPDTGPMGDFVRGWLAARLADSAGGEGAALMRRFLEARTYW